MSVMMTRPRDRVPPPPIPWTERPARSWVKFWARQHTSVPIVKSRTDENKSWRRPKTSDNATMKGWKMAHVRR